jgi:site-specific DNA-methyltransferase (adenine-specific)
MISKALTTSRSDEWATPQDIFNELNNEFHFNLDPCANESNYKCNYYFTKEQDGLIQNWGGHRVFCNPPYGRRVGLWVEKAYKESQKPDTLVVMLIPARTDTKWFHKFVYGKAEIRFIEGRLKYGNARYNAPFPSMVIIFGKE